MQEVIVNVGAKEVRVACLKNGIMTDLIVKRTSSKNVYGNIYKGKIINILSSIDSAFVDIKESNNGFIRIEEIFDNKKAKYATEEIINKTLMVQVKKEPTSKKGAQLTCNITIPGRYIVITPKKLEVRISKKIQSQKHKERLENLGKTFVENLNAGIIMRTSSRLIPNKIIEEEATALIKEWLEIKNKFQDKNFWGKLYQTKGIITDIIFKALDIKANKIIVDDVETYKTIISIYEKYSTEHQLNIQLHNSQMPLFESFGLEKEIKKALNKQVTLQSGAYIFFETTEAMHTIDVNSGNSSYNDQNATEENLLNINIEAAKEIARQIRIRNITGIISCDFIDMQLLKNQNKIIETIKSSMKEESVKWQILRISKFGTLQITRQRTREPLNEIIFEKCPHCKGRGLTKTKETVAIDIQREIKKVLSLHKQNKISVLCNPDIQEYISDMLPRYIDEISSNNRKIEVRFEPKQNFQIDRFEIIDMK